VCKVFEKVNTSGISLTMFELVVAKFAANAFNLSNDWKKRYAVMTEKFPILSVFKDSPENFLIAIILFSRYQKSKASSEKPPTLATFKREGILDLELEEYKNYADNIEEGFKEAASFLREEQIFDKKELPYAGQLIPLAVMSAILNANVHQQANIIKLSQWFWSGVFGELYGSSVESRYAKDITGMLAWIEGGDRPDEAKADFSPLRLLELNTRNSVPYKGITALILKNGAKDFISGKKMSEVLYSKEAFDIHHIFPKAWCKDRFDKKKWDSVVNKTPLSTRSNTCIGGAAPSVYLSKIRKEGSVTTDEALNAILESHLIDANDMRANNFNAYFIKRAKALLRLISEAMGKEIVGWDSQEVIEAYGESLKYF